MADNYTVKDGNGTALILGAKDRTSYKVTRHHVADGDNEALGAMADAAAGTDTQTASLIALFKRLLGKYSANEGHLGEVHGASGRWGYEVIRPADTTAYAAGDSIANVTTPYTGFLFSNIVARKNGGSGEVTGVRVVTDKYGITPRLRVHFLNAPLAVLAGDNNPWKVTYATVGWLDAYLGSVDLPAMTSPADPTSDVSQAADHAVRFPFFANVSARSLYFALETLDAFTPDSGQKFHVTATLMLD